ADLRLAMVSAGTRGGDAIEDLGLADRPHLRGAALAMHRAGLHKHGRHDIVTAGGIHQQIIKQIAPLWPIPQMVVRINDRQVGLGDWLPVSIKPSLAYRKIIRGCGCAWWGGCGAPRVPAVVITDY